MLVKVEYFGTSRLVERKLVDRAASVLGRNILLGLVDPEDGGTTPFEVPVTVTLSESMGT